MKHSQSNRIWVVAGIVSIACSLTSFGIVDRKIVEERKEQNRETSGAKTTGQPKEPILYADSSLSTNTTNLPVTGDEQEPTISLVRSEKADKEKELVPQDSESDSISVAAPNERESSAIWQKLSSIVTSITTVFSSVLPLSWRLPADIRSQYNSILDRANTLERQMKGRNGFISRSLAETEFSKLKEDYNAFKASLEASNDPNVKAINAHISPALRRIDNIFGIEFLANVFGGAILKGVVRSNLGY